MGYLGFTRSEKLILVCSAALSALAAWYARKALIIRYRDTGYISIMEKKTETIFGRERERV